MNIEEGGNPEDRCSSDTLVPPSTCSFSRISKVYGETVTGFTVFNWSVAADEETFGQHPVDHEDMWMH